MNSLKTASEISLGLGILWYSSVPCNTPHRGRNQLKEVYLWAGRLSPFWVGASLAF